MAAAIGSSFGTGNSKTAGTTLTVTIDSSIKVTAGNLLVLGIGADNLSTTTPTITSIAKPAGETNSWAQVVAGNAHTATAAGGVRSFIWAILTTVDWPVSTTYDITFSGTITAKAYCYAEFTGCTATARSTAASATAASGGSLSCTPTGTAPVVGDLRLGCGVNENTPSYNGDTTGSWTAATSLFASFTAGGGAASNVTVNLQYNIAASTSQLAYAPASLADGSACTQVLQQSVAAATKAPPPYTKSGARMRTHIVR